MKSMSFCSFLVADFELHSPKEELSEKMKNRDGGRVRGVVSFVWEGFL